MRSVGVGVGIVVIGSLAWLAYAQLNRRAFRRSLLRRFEGDPRSGANGQPTPRGIRYQPIHLPNFRSTPTATVGKQFTRAVYEAARSLGLSELQAEFVCAMVDIETGSGSHVTNYNIGNVRAYATTTAPWHRTHSGRPWRSYHSLREGVQGVLETMRQPIHREGYQMFRQSDPNFYGVLMRTYGEPGDSTDDEQAQFNFMVRVVRRWLRGER